MLKIGLTGNIASGKSTVADVWRRLGARVVDADELARQAVEPGSPALRRIVARWGVELLEPSGALDRGALRQIVFRDPEARAELEAIVHPQVAALRDQAFADAATAGERLVVADIPLLFEVGLEEEFDIVVLVDAPEAVRRARIIETRRIAPAEADRMISAQMPSAQKRTRAHYVIDNDGSLEALTEKATALWREIAASAGNNT